MKSQLPPAELEPVSASGFLKENLEGLYEAICKDSPLTPGPKFWDILKEKVNNNCKDNNIILKNCHIGQEACAFLVDILADIDLFSLNVTQNHLSNEGLEKIIISLTCKPSLKVLEIGSNQITTVGAEALAEMLKQNKTITALEVGHDKAVRTKNEIKSDGAIAIVESLCQNCSLRSLGLAGNSIGREAAYPFFTMLSYNKALTSLDLSRNNLCARS
eukprot:15085_1